MSKISPTQSFFVRYRKPRCWRDFRYNCLHPEFARKCMDNFFPSGPICVEMKEKRTVPVFGYADKETFRVEEEFGENMSEDLSPEEQKKLRKLSNRFEHWEMPDIPDGTPTKWGWTVRRPERLILGAGTDIGSFTYIQAEEGVTIEEGVQIGSSCSIYSVSTINNKRGRVLLKKNCKIGSHSIIMPGVTIGENAVVGPYCYVTHDIPDNVVFFHKPNYITKENKI